MVKVGIKSGSQQYRCKDCKRKFVPITGFERISADPQVVCLALDLSFKGLSLREVTDSKPQRYPENNKVGRLNGGLRKRQKVARGLKKPTGPLTRGHAAYYNLMRPHQALGGKTPAEASMGTVPLSPRWLAHIQAAATKSG